MEPKRHPACAGTSIPCRESAASLMTGREDRHAIIMTAGAVSEVGRAAIILDDGPLR